MLPGWDAPPGAISPDFHWTLGSCTQLPSNTFQMQRIRGYYRGLVPQASQFFDPPETDAQFQAAVGTMGLQSSPGQRLFTGASLVAAINSILGGAGLAVLAARVADLGDGRRWRSALPSRWCCLCGTCCINSGAAPMSCSGVSWPTATG